MYIARVVVCVFVAAAVLSGGCSKAPDSDKLLSQVQELRAKGDVDAAVIQLKNLLQATPDNKQARLALGQIYLEQGDIRSAEKELTRAKELGADPASVAPALGRALVMLGEFNRVLDTVRVEGALKPEQTAELQTIRGLASLGLRRPADARKMFDEALAAKSDFPDALIGQSRLAASEKDTDGAIRLVQRAIDVAPTNHEAWMLRGDLARALSDSAGAAAAYQKAIELKPKDVSSRVSLASLQVAIGAVDESKGSVEALKKLAPNHQMVNYLQAMTEFRKGNYTGARDSVLLVLKVAPNHLPSVLLAGAVEFALGSHVQAQSYLSRVLERQKGNVYARKLLVASLLKSGQVPRAQEALEPILAGASEDASVMALAGEVSMQANDFAKARQFFEKAAKLDPKSAGARTGLGLSRLAAGETDSAMADLESAGQLDSGKFQADILLVMSNLQQSKFDQALKAVQALEKKQPDNPLTYNLKAAAYIGKKDIAAARKSLERALELQPAYVPAATNLAQLDLQAKNPQAAKGRFDAILNKDPKNVQALLALASMASRLGAGPKEQAEWLERARKASPGAVQPLLLLARHFMQGNDPKKALEYAQQALVIAPENVEVLDTLGSIQMATGDKNQALATYNKLVTLQQSSPAPYYRLAGVQAANNDATGAMQSLNKALSIRPDFIEAQAALVELQVRGGKLQGSGGFGSEGEAAVTQITNRTCS